MKNFLLNSFCFAVLLFSLSEMSAQESRYFTKSGKISFYSKAPLENIEAVNYSTTAVLDATSGKMEFSVLIPGFEFEKKLMQEHFNENYMESSKYPKSTFKGSITNMSSVNLKKDGTYNVTVAGNLTIKDRTNPVSATGKITVSSGKVVAESAFNVKLADYNVKIPAAVKDNISETISIKVYTDLKPM